ncbi:phage portal protein [Gehongia tenuis]|uniref:Phage portal protein n=1 Tax=Gehongia tenuis TaxID=2763655 RepID=A0A926D3D5_9FIRM|nr:phage portal protein [Gehongia tenuis]MBC8530563.1 phage portal protein [Gehongia tenuis]
MFLSQTDVVQAALEAHAPMSLEQILLTEIREFEGSAKRRFMLQGMAYYRGENDILLKHRTGIGEDGYETVIQNLANNRIAHGFIQKLVDQKKDYLLSRPISIDCRDPHQQRHLTDFFDREFMRVLKNVGASAVVEGEAYLQVFYDPEGRLRTMLIPASQVIPFFEDEDGELGGLIRFYDLEGYEGRHKILQRKVEYWHRDGVDRYREEGGRLILEGREGHFTVEGKPACFGRVPFVVFRYNALGRPLIANLKALVDEYDKRVSQRADSLEDLPNSVYVLKNFDGENLGEFRKNLMSYRAVKVSGDGGVDTLSLPGDGDSLEDHLKRLRKDIYEFGRGVDTQSERFGASPSGVALKFLYADLDMDASEMESEFQAALHRLLWFVNFHIRTCFGEDFDGKPVEFVLNRDILINETDAIDNCVKSVGILSERTILANHPWVVQVELEEARKLEDEAKAGEAEREGPGAEKPGDGETMNRKKAGAKGPGGAAGEAGTGAGKKAGAKPGAGDTMNRKKAGATDGAESKDGTEAGKKGEAKPGDVCTEYLAPGRRLRPRPKGTVPYSGITGTDPFLSGFHKRLI